MMKLSTLRMYIAVLGFITSKATILVVPNQYATIQSAIDAALNGDTVEVAPGP